MPGLHRVHSVAPAAEKVPAMHARHSFALRWKPAGQVVSAHALAPWVVEWEPIGQASQLVEPPASANRPAAQLVHAVAPAAAEDWPAGQVMHWLPPVVPLKLPSAHKSHLEALALETEPAAQDAQLVAAAAAA